MKKILLSLFALSLVSGIFAQLENYELMLYLDFEDEADLAYNDQDLFADEVEYTAEFSSDSKFGDGAASFDGMQYIIFDPVEGWDLATVSFTWAAWVKTDADGGTICSWAPYSGTPAVENGTVDENDPHGAAVHSLFWGFTGPVPCYDVGWVALTEGVTAINDGAWHHIAVTVDNENFVQQVYVNGVAEGDEPGDWDIATSLSELYLEEPDMEPDLTTFRMKVGYSTSGWPADEATEEIQWPYFTGVMDDFRMYEGALTADDVLELYETEATSARANLQEAGFAVYPNPAAEYIRIRTGTVIGDLSIFNSLGQLVVNKQQVTNGSMITISELDPGIYIVKSGNQIQKLMIE
jgi:hypothetical protein